MVSYILIIIAAASFSAGLMFIVRGYSSDEDDMKAVPISDIHEIDEFKKVYTSDKKIDSSNRETWIIPGKPRPDPSFVAPKKADTSTSLAYTSTIYDQQNKIMQLEQEILLLKGTRNEDLKRLEDKIYELNLENNRLKETLERELGINKNLQALSEEKHAYFENINMQFLSSQDNVIQLAESNKTLTDNFERLQNQWNEAQKLITQQRLEIAELEKQKNLFAEQFSEAQQQITVLSDKLISVEANLISEKEQMEQAKQTTHLTADASIVQFNDRIKQLEAQCDELRQAKIDLTRNFEKIKELNESLLDKEQSLYYELTKSRAQSLGLSKICEDFKGQIETMRNGVRI